MKKTQKIIVEEMLKRDGYVDNIYCVENKITLRLGAIINVLRNEGWQFDDEKSGFLPGTNNWRYYLKKDARQPFQPKYRYELVGGVMREIPV